MAASPNATKTKVVTTLNARRSVKRDRSVLSNMLSEDVVLHTA